ncbi:MAG TPA: 16S rRNA (guanine(966)-N(2))-methyltransferase RsmD [Bacteroidales bacterium]|nr:16S rRNA (guanine(966)-N(2))-methyltransferase RsmD [Bacteroidales bacterium]
MRIISGKYGGRRLHPPVNLPVRPTTDMAKESLFNILSNTIDFEGMSVLDLFAGTGSISLEFVSRGCAEVTAVDKDSKCVSFLIKTCEEFKIDNLRAYRSDVFSYIKHSIKKYHIIFADPPYDLKSATELPDKIFEKELLMPDGLLIIEHSRDHDFSKHPKFSQHRNYGKVNFSFFEA